MVVQAIRDAGERGHLVGGVALFGIIGLVFIALAPAKQSMERASASAAQDSRGFTMPDKITNLTNKAGDVVATVSFDEDAHAWRLASKAEPTFQRMFPRYQAAFYFWYSRFDPQSGKLRRSNGRPD